MREGETRDILGSHQICFAQHGTLYVTVKAGIGAYQDGLGEVMHMMKDRVLYINVQGIATLAIDDINGASQEHTLLFLPHEDVVSAIIKIKLLHFLFTIETRKGIIVYKLHKNVLASSWHKENLSSLLLNLSSTQEKGGSMGAGAIFDMDSLLFDTELAYDQEWHYTAELYDLKVDPAILDELRGANGIHTSEIVNMYWSGVDTEKPIDELFAHAIVTLSKQVPMKLDVMELLEYLRQYAARTAVASSTSMELIKSDLHLAGIADYFGAVVNGEQVEHGKPFPDVFLLAVQRLNLQVQDCYVSEDGINGARAGIQAGCSTTMVSDLVSPTKELYEQRMGIYPSPHVVLHVLQTYTCQGTICPSYGFQR